MERAARNEWWGDHMMRQPADVLVFRDACRRLQERAPNGEVGEEPHEAEPEPYDTEYYERRPPTQSTSHSPPPPPDPPTGRRRDEMRNAMGPSLWQLVSAAIPDDDEPTPRREAEREWAPPMWTAPPPRDEYTDGPKRKRRADLFW
jgi:hypothetical protein